MSLENTVSNIYDGLTSDRVTERKKCADSLKELLGGTGLPVLLNENHRRNTGHTWKSLFLKVHDWTIKEAEKFDSGKGTSAYQNVMGQSSSLLFSLISGANRNKCFISSDRLVQCCVDVLKSSRLVRATGDTYVKLISKHIINTQHYLTNLTPYEWADLLEVSIELSSSSNIERLLSVCLVKDIIERGVTRCHLILPIRDSLTALTNLYITNDFECQHHLQENVLNLAILVIQNVAAESRLAVCEFTEAIVPHIIKFYEQTSDAFSNKKRLLFTFLYLSITVHHPGGRFANQSGILVKDWVLWRAALVSIHQIIVCEAIYQGNSVKRGNSQTQPEFMFIQLFQPEVCAEFLNLAVEFYHQNFNGSLHCQTDCEETQPPKRCRMESTDFSTLSQLMQFTTSNYYPWLSITAMYLKKYVKTVTSSDVEQFLHILSTLVLSDNPVQKFSSVCQVIGIVCSEIGKGQWHDSYAEPLLIIWNTCVRKVSIDSMVFGQCHNAIQRILEIESFDAPLNTLMKSYSDKTMPATANSLDTLSSTLLHYNYKITDKNIKLQVAQWVLNNCADLLRSHTQVPFVLFLLCIHENVPHKQEIKDKKSIEEYLFGSYECVMLKSDFEDGLLVEERKEEPEITETTNSLSVSEKIFDHITTNLNTSINESILKNIDSITSLTRCIHECAITLEFISLFKKFNIFNSVSDIKTLYLTAKDELNLIILKLPSFLNSRTYSIKEKEDILKQVKRLYTKSNYSSTVYDLICKTTSKDLIECCCALIDESDNAMEENNTELMGMNTVILVETEVYLKQTILEILANFCARQSIFCSQILKYILEADTYKNFDSKDEFMLAINIATFVTTQFKLEDVPIGSILMLLQIMCRKLFRDNYSAFCILTLLHGILDTVGKLGTKANRENCTIMLSSFIQRCKSKNYAPKTMAQAFKCLSWIQNLSNIEDWGKQMDGILLQGLSNTIFSIRLCACVCLGHSMREASSVKFHELVASLPEVFLLDLTGLTQNVIADESANKASTVLHCLATIAVTSPVWDKKALSSIIQIATSKNISRVLLNKVFVCISKHLKIESVESLISDNIEFLLVSWLNNSLLLDNFPYYLTGCMSKEEFYLNYCQILIPLEMFYVRNDKRISPLVELIAKKSMTSVEKTLEECLPNALAICLPHIISQSSGNSERVTDKRYGLVSRSLLATFTDKLGTQSLKKLTANKLVEIIKIVLKNYCHKENIRDELGWAGALPFMDGPTVTNIAFNSIINYLNESLSIDVIFHLCNDNPFGVQELLLHLWADIGLHHTLERRLLSLHQYWVFCHTLPLETNLNTFICSFIIHSLLHIINSHKATENMQYMCIGACKMLHSMIAKMLPDLSNLVSRFLSLIVNTVSQAALESAYIRTAVKSLLEFLLIDMKAYLLAIQTLDPLPDEEYFSNLNNVLNGICLKTNDTLYKQIENFLNGGLTGRYEGLKVLHYKLKNSRTELAALFEKLKEIRGFSEDCKDSILHQLSCALIQIASDGSDIESSLQACRCLGELGVADYHTLVLRPSMDPHHIIEMTPLQYLSYTSLALLNNLFHNPDPRIARASSKALTSLLAFKEGNVALDFLSHQEGMTFIKDLLMPFMTPRKNHLCAKIKINDDHLDGLIRRQDLWQSQDPRGHSHWIVNMTSSLLKCFAEHDCFLHNFMDISQSNISFSETLLPCLIGLLHLYGSEDQINKIRSNIQTFFNNYYEGAFNSPSIGVNKSTAGPNHLKESPDGSKKSYKIFSKESVRCMLELVKFLSIQKKHYKNLTKSRNADDCNNLMEFDYLSICWAASCTGAHFAAIYYGELWGLSSPHLQLPSNPDKISSLHRGEHILSILRKSYLAIGDIDALNGCGSAHLLNPAERRNFYMRMGSFSDALLMQDLALSNCEPNSQSQIETIDDTNNSFNLFPTTALESNVISERSFASSLQMSGLYHLAGKYMDASAAESSLDDLKFECFWRLGNWSLQVDSAYLKSKTQKCSDSGINIQSEIYWPAYHYISLKDSITRSFNSADLSLNNALREARQYVASYCMKNSLESCQSSYELSTKLQILQEIEHFVAVKAIRNNDEENYGGLLVSWSTKSILPFSDFKHVEPILAQRVVILESLSKHSSGAGLQLSVAELQLQYAELALSHGWVQAATRWINNASRSAQALLRLSSASGEELALVAKLSGLIRMAEGRAAWCGGHQDVALHLVKTLITNGNNGDSLLHANALRLYGSWMVETRSESAMEILDNYLNKSLEILGANGNVSAKINAYLTIARFSDGEYKQMDTYMKSAAFVNKIKCMERCKDTAVSLKEKHQASELSRDERKALFFNDGQGNIDEIEISNTQSERDHYLQLAIRCYLSSLSDGEENNLCVFRVISLWLDNPSLVLEGSSERSLVDFFKCIPSRKFLPVIPQLAPRINSVNGKPYQQIIYYLMERCLIEHPHHTLPIVLALKNSNKDAELLCKTTKRSQTSNNEEPYIATAKKMLDSVSRKGNANLTNIIQQTDLLSIALISLANLKVNQKPPEQPVPKSEPIKKLKQLNLTLVPTVTVPVKKNGKYDDIPTVVSFSEKFILVGGVNVPKKLSCRGSDGIERLMLLKGEDDIRQDAVMQQVFIIVNHLLASNQQTRRRRLLIRTYKVVALSRRSGVIEWCEGTEPLGRLLVGGDGSGGYHARLRPSDITSRDARKMMTDKHTANNEVKLNVFKSILAGLKPVFHHFFFENFLLPAVWYERRLAYTHSVATSSMIGYILGLGDRHVQNILIDKSTAEVIHIDFGVAFEQGRVQRTPETVPFRLTQDMVAGMGLAGVEGVFRRSCEKTMDVLRANQETLLTILEVLLCDPLYMWTISPLQAYSKQDLPTPSLTNYNTDASGSGSEAERALLRVRNKLEGMEFGSALATPGQVARLLQQATDSNNLSRLFPGWQPYL